MSSPGLEPILDIQRQPSSQYFRVISRQEGTLEDCKRLKARLEKALENQKQLDKPFSWYEKHLQEGHSVDADPIRKGVFFCRGCSEYLFAQPRTEQDKQLLNVIYNWYGGKTPRWAELESDLANYKQNEQIVRRLRERNKKLNDDYIKYPLDYNDEDTRVMGELQALNDGVDYGSL